MIPVHPQPKPSGFDSAIKSKGDAFLQTTPHPTSDQWKGKEYWRDAIPDLVKAYNSICAYCAQWISFPTGTPTVDHYIPRIVQPPLAYEWTNFRLSSLRLNSRKREFQDVLDPFKIPPDWFIIDFTSFMVLPNPSLSVAEKQQIMATLVRLQLNDEDFIESRREWFKGIADKLRNLSLCQEGIRLFWRNLSHEQIILSQTQEKQRPPYPRYPAKPDPAPECGST